MKVIPFKRNENDPSAVEKSLNLADVATQKLDELKNLLEHSYGSKIDQSLIFELKRINSQLDNAMLGLKKNK